MRLTREIENSLKEKILKRERKYEGNFLIMEKVHVELPNGENSSRDVLLHPGAVTVIALNDKNEVLLEYQYRTPFDEVICEIPAGKVDNGEDRDRAALRELKEETGYHAESLRRLGDLYLAPGYCDEIITVYLAEELRMEESSPDEDEFVRPFFLPLEEAYDMISDGRIKDAKTIAALGMLRARR